MAGAITGFESSGRNSDKVVRIAEGPTNSDFMIFGFWEEVGNESSESSWGSGEGEGVYIGGGDVGDDEIDEEENSDNVEKNKAFWKAQDELLQATLYRTNSLESKIRQVIKDALNELTSSTTSSICTCRKPVAEGCRICLRREISGRLQNAGYNCAICKSKWRNSPDIPSGEHTYLEVLDKSNSKKGEVRVVIELNFRGEFEMARASEEYIRLITRLPEVFVGKVERLRALIKILCSASKKCMKDKKMHMGPWRKQKYMKAKWFGTCERTTLPLPLPLPIKVADRPPKPRASMLTFDLMENMSSLHHSTAVKVL